MSVVAPHQQLSCTFCKKSQYDVKKLIASPDRLNHICNECITQPGKLKFISDRPDRQQTVRATLSVRVSAFLRDLWSSPSGKPFRCSFCQKKRCSVGFYGSSLMDIQAQICGDCLTVCRKILNDEAGEESYASGFDQAWNVVARSRDGQPVSPTLRPLLKAVYVQSLSQPLNPIELQKAIEDLLQFLIGEGRTNANCWAVDLFFANSQGWERDWAEQGLPEDFHDILAMMGEALHDTVQHPEIAKNYGCLPEQLLERVKHFRGNSR